MVGRTTRLRWYPSMYNTFTRYLIFRHIGLGVMINMFVNSLCYLALLYVLILPMLIHLSLLQIMILVQ
ncbi:hypothetical protein EYC84_004082 [Monilinia fructicola]|uniref:Uncharacterized protein n=1 Tax=Monilinia fructicola TaxID=38448 RepID=A0A5M9JZ70_MONFR|nr:hypothetical protein EYC84_004082 [Monilinia fructicola]